MDTPSVPANKAATLAHYQAEAAKAADSHKRSMPVPEAKLHPSRAAPKCSDCTAKTKAGFCDHPAMPVSLVTGNPLIACQEARAEEGGACGSAAALFVRRDGSGNATGSAA